MDKKTKPYFLFLTVWGLIQILRLVAIGVIMEVLGHTTNEAWMFPAVLDNVVAVTAPAFTFVIWKRRTLGTWVFSLIFWTLSIIDHIDGAVAASLSSAPSVFGAGQSSSETIISVLIPAVIDLAAFVILCLPSIRKLFIKE